MHWGLNQPSFGKEGWYLNQEFSLNPTLQTSEAADGLAHISLIRPQNLPSVFRENLKAALTVITVETRPVPEWPQPMTAPEKPNWLTVQAPSLTRKAERYSL